MMILVYLLWYDNISESAAFKEMFGGCQRTTKQFVIQWNLNLRKPDLRKNLDLRKIVGTTDFLVHKLFDLRKIF